MHGRLLIQSDVYIYIIYLFIYLYLDLYIFCMYIYIYAHVGLSPFPVVVTIRLLTFLVWDSCKPSLATLILGRGTTWYIQYIYIYNINISLYIPRIHVCPKEGITPTFLFQRGVWILRVYIHMCQGLNSHYFHIIGDGHQPNSRGLYTHYKDSVIFQVGGLPSPTKRDF